MDFVGSIILAMLNIRLTGVIKVSFVHIAISGSVCARL